MRQQRLSVTLAAIGAALGVVVACSTGQVVPDQDASVQPEAAPAGPCPGGLTDCGNGKCAQTKRDPENCGKCGQACKAGEFCVQGSCSFTCGGGATRCGTICANVKADGANCGQCGTKCSTGQVCNMGTCAATCQAGLTACGQSCVDLQSDDDNCGACGAACDAGQRCAAGKCQASCQAGWTSCADGDGGTTCVDVRNDPNNCGACGNKCANGWFCTPTGDGGAPGCQLQCFGGSTRCGNKCVDTQMDPGNCGGCNAGCGMNQICTSGHCCAPGEGYCNGACRPANQCGVVYNGNFTQNQWNQQQCTDWNTWRGLLVGSYTSITIKGTQDPTGVSCTGAAANTLCQALRNNTAVNVGNCDGHVWATGSCGAGIELTATGTICQCNSGYTSRPCIGNGNPNWGGVNTTTCNAPTQTITVVCQ